MSEDKKSDSEKDDEKEAAKQVAEVFSGSMTSLAIGFGIMMAFSLIGMPIMDYFYGAENRPEWFGEIGFSIFLGFILSDPYEAWKNKKMNYRFYGKFGLGFAMGMMINFMPEIVPSGETASDGAPAGSEPSQGEGKTLSLWQFWPVFIPLLMMPILFGTHALTRFEKNKDAPMKERLADAALEYVDTSGPIIMMLVMGVCMLFFWIVSMPFNMLIAFLTTILIGIIIYCAVFYDGAEPPITDDGDYEAPRSKGFGDAFSKILDISVAMLPGAIFVTGLIFVAMAFWDFADMKISKGDDFNPMFIIWPVIKASLIGILVVPGGMMVASLAGALGIGGWAQLRRMGFDEAKMRAEKFSEILYFGAMGKMFHGTLEKRDE